MKKIPIYEPHLGGNEKKYVLDCLESNWISSRGKYVGRFEIAFSDYIGSDVVSTSCSNGTVALHLALLALGVGEGDEVIVPSFTYVASVNAIKYVGAKPVFVDSDVATWNASLSSIKNVVTKKTKAIMCVHIYGVPCDMENIVSFARQRGLFVIEDCAEALGSRVAGAHVGTSSDISTFSFFGNKTITTGEGGMVASQHRNLIECVAHLKSQAVSTSTPYWHDSLGYNYRLTNVASAIGLGQLERIDQILNRKQEIAERYRESLEPSGVSFQWIDKNNVSSHWLSVALMPSTRAYTKVIKACESNNIETRPAFPLVSKMPHFSQHAVGEFPVGERIGQRAICLPSFPSISNEDLDLIINVVKSELQNC